MESIQRAASLHDICVGKTGTLTKGKMDVAEYHLFDRKQTFIHEDDAFEQRLPIPAHLKELVKECIISNTDIGIETKADSYMYEPIGQALEVGMIQFLIDNAIDVPNLLIERNKNARKLA